MKKLVWNVIYRSSSRNEIGVFNVFDHGRFMEDVNSHLKKCKTKDELSEALKHSMMYYFWSKYECEILISALNERDAARAIKVDAYWQVKNNWELFVDYVLSAKKKSD